jgi:hypothetical protein
VAISLICGNTNADPGHSHANHDRAFLEWADSLKASQARVVRTMLVGTIVSVDAKEQVIELSHGANQILGLETGVSKFRYESYDAFVKIQPGQRVRLAMIAKDGVPVTIDRLDRVLDD